MRKVGSDFMAPSLVVSVLGNSAFLCSHCRSLTYPLTALDSYFNTVGSKEGAYVPNYQDCVQSGFSTAVAG